MTNTSTPVLIVIVAFAGVLASACCCPGEATDPEDPTLEPKKTETKAKEAPAPEDLLVTVNGAYISQLDVEYKLRKNSHSKEVTPQGKKNALETIIRMELAKQKAEELGLDTDPEYLRRLQARELEINEFRRRELSELYYKREAVKNAEVTSEEAKKYFDENTEMIQTELHLWHIMRKGDRAAIEQDLEKVRAGASFEEVARAKFPNLSEKARNPADVGYLIWRKIPEPWREAIYKLKKGEVSDVIPGPNNRYWIVKLVDKRTNADLKFEDVEKTIINGLKAEKIAGNREKTDQRLKEEAKIEYYKPKQAVSTSED